MHLPRRLTRSACGIALLFVTALAAPLAAQPIDLRLTPVATGLSQLVDIVHAGDGSGRLYFVQQDGVVRVFADGSLRPAPLLDIRTRVRNEGEQGLLSIAFAPGFPQPPHLFAWYSTPGPHATLLVRYSVDAATLTIDPSSEQELLRLPQPFENHNGGKLAFGPDGFLYLSTGDGGGAGDPLRRAQDLGSLLGKILRLDVRTLPYTIPPGNPFANQPGARPEIWSYGLRNPWKIGFDRAGGALWIADVGQARREEINRASAGVGGQNWGWSCREGSLEFAAGDSCRGSPPVDPVAEYGREQGCSITGGHVYRGHAHPSLHGLYLAGDFCTGRIFALPAADPAAGLTMLLDTPHSISSFGEDESGEVYVADYFGGVYRLSDGEPPDTPLDLAQVGSQYWLTGVGTLLQRTLLAELSSATGARFGAAFDAADVVRKRWGTLEIEFTGCDAGLLRWRSSGEDSAGFGNGGYPLQRIAATAASQQCHQLGFGNASSLEWVSGTWFGGAARSGEGVFLDRLADGRVLVAFFTYRPPGAP
jgi:glucose/arabinose dehydrogenase